MGDLDQKRELKRVDCRRHWDVGPNSRTPLDCLRRRASFRRPPVDGLPHIHDWGKLLAGRARQGALGARQLNYSPNLIALVDHAAVATDRRGHGLHSELILSQYFRSAFELFCE